MSKLIYVHSRNELPYSAAVRLNALCRHLAPDNITPNPPRIVVGGKQAYGIINPVPSVLEQDTSILLGAVFEQNSSWDEFARDLDGSYALFRDGEDLFEIRSDPAGSRTIWYYFDEETFIASTSQRAIIAWLGSFNFNEKVIPWMFSTGTLGPSLSWDRRIYPLPADSSLTLSKRNWSLSETSRKVVFAAEERPEQECRDLLGKSIDEVFINLDIDISDWVLPLSGGYDSRAILFLLKKFRDIGTLKSITWGKPSSLLEEGNDAFVASKLADSIGISHRYLNTQLADGSAEQVMDRFFCLGEGRVDHFGGYMDGFELWKTLFELGSSGIIRGDEAFGWIQVHSPLQVRRSLGCALCSDFANLRSYREFGFDPQDTPKQFQQRQEESLATWRDRLYREFRIPVVLSALSDLKLTYVELVNPFLSRRILDVVCQLEDPLRTEKHLFKSIVRDLSDIEFATKGANETRQDSLSRDDMQRLMRSGIDASGPVFPRRFIDGLWSEAGLESKEKPLLNNELLKFRVFLIGRMNEILTSDSSVLRGY